MRSVAVSASGIFTGSAAETRIKANALAGLLDDYELSFESGERMGGRDHPVLRGDRLLVGPSGWKFGRSRLRDRKQRRRERDP